jgi:hypothetical protein
MSGGFIDYNKQTGAFIIGRKPPTRAKVIHLLAFVGHVRITNCCSDGGSSNGRTADSGSASEYFWGLVQRQHTALWTQKLGFESLIPS